MSVTHTLSLDPRFPVGTVLTIYRGWQSTEGGVAVTTATVGSDRLTPVRGLDYDTRYTAAATVGSVWLTTRFVTRPNPTVNDDIVRVVSEAPLNPKYPEYGAVGDNSTDDTDALRSAALAAAIPGGKLWLPSGAYLVDTSAGPVFNVGPGAPLIVEGESTGEITASAATAWGTRIRRTAGTNPIAKLLGTGTGVAQRAHGGLVNIELNGGGLAGTVLHLERCNDLTIDRLRVHSATSYGLVCRQVFNTVMDKLIVGACGNGSSVPAMLVDGFVGESSCDTLTLMAPKFEDNLGTDLIVGDATQNPAFKIRIVAPKFESNSTIARSYPMLNLAHVDDIAVIGPAMYIFSLTATGKFIVGGAGAANTRTSIKLSAVELDHRGTPTEFVLMQGGNRWMVAGLYCTGTPSNKYVKIDSALSATALSLRGYVPATQSKAMDDQRAGSDIMGGYLKVPFEKTSGATVTEYATSLMPNWSLADGANGIVQGTVRIPQDAAPGMPIEIHAMWSTPTTVNTVNLTAEAFRIVEGATANGTRTTDPQTGLAASATANFAKTTKFLLAGAITPNPGDEIGVRFFRPGAADSYSDVVNLRGLTVRYERQL